MNGGLIWFLFKRVKTENGKVCTTSDRRYRTTIAEEFPAVIALPVVNFQNIVLTENLKSSGKELKHLKKQFDRNSWNHFWSNPSSATFLWELSKIIYSSRQINLRDSYEEQFIIDSYFLIWISSLLLPLLELWSLIIQITRINTRVPGLLTS